MGIEVESCYRRYAPMVYRRCLGLLGDERLAEDALQDVFVRLLRDRHRLDDRALSGLLYRIATHVSLNQLRSRRRRPEEGSESLLHAVAAADDIEQQTWARGILERVLGASRPDTRVMATLHYVDGWTLAQVAQEVGMSVSGVRKRLRGLRGQLRELEDRP